MKERASLITMKGNPLTLLGNELKVGDKAPECIVVDSNLNQVKIPSFKGKVGLILTVPSLDTSTCSLETKRFNQEMAKFGDRVSTVVVSMDLPFAQKRWCGAEGVNNLQVVSDYHKREVGEKFGVLIKELSLLARAAFIVDAEGKIKHIYLVKEVSSEPDYKAILSNVQDLLPVGK